VPDRPGSYVFFVTFGQIQGEHKFDESITDSGVLTWQSQPRQRLSTPTIQQFIHHDDRTDNIYLFLRTRLDSPYTYCGTLGYLAHDLEREQPVHFQWQLMDWPAPDGVLKSLAIQPIDEVPTADSPTPAPGSLERGPRPQPARPGGKRTRDFAARRNAVHPNQDARNSQLGLAGEKLVLRSEIVRLRAAGRPDLSDQVVHVSVVEGDGAGYDIRSFDDKGGDRYLEVKTTRGPDSTAFFVSPNEVAFSQAHPDSYVLVRVHSYDDESESGRCYEEHGDIAQHFSLTPTEYRASLVSPSQAR
jgi:hypothetical protein